METVSELEAKRDSEVAERRVSSVNAEDSQVLAAAQGRAPPGDVERVSIAWVS